MYQNSNVITDDGQDARKEIDFMKDCLEKPCKGWPKAEVTFAVKCVFYSVFKDTRPMKVAIFARKNAIFGRVVWGGAAKGLFDRKTAHKKACWEEMAKRVSSYYIINVIFKMAVVTYQKLRSSPNGDKNN